jgi:Tfp pilus assembly protein PilN
VIQQVNLYHPIFRREQKKFSAVAMLQAGGVLIVGALLMYLFAWWQVGYLRSQIGQIEHDQQAAMHQLEEVNRTLAVRQPDPRLQEEVRDLSARLNASEKIEAMLSHDAFARSAGYSDYFAAFARQAVPGLWLTGIAITGAGAQLLLRGRSTRAELVPRYLEKLSAEKSLSGIRFLQFQITRPEKAEVSGVPVVEFLVKSGAVEDESTSGEGK